MIFTVLQILPMILSLSAAFFFIRGSIGLNPKVIASLSSNYYGGNSAVLKSLSKQHADNLIGGIFLLIAFVIQFYALYRGPTQDELGSANKYGVLTGISVGVIIFLIGLFLSCKLSKKTQDEASVLLKSKE